MKPCIICKEIKPLEDFYLQKGMKDGHLNKCKDCCKKQAKYRWENNIHRPERQLKDEKECIICHKIKKLGEFYEQKGMFDGHLNKCIECCLEYADSRHKIDPHYYMRAIYNGMVWRCKNIERYKKLKIVNKNEWVVWCDKNMYKFNVLFKNWQNSGFDKKLSPSIDRIDNNRGYELDNMQWLTHSQNSKKGNK